MHTKLSNIPADLERKGDEGEVLSDIREALKTMVENSGQSEERIEKMLKRVEQLELKAGREQFGVASRGGELTAAEAEHKQAFGKWVRKGDDRGLLDIEGKAMSIGSSADGGYALPKELDTQINAYLRAATPLRQFARVVQTGSADFRTLVNALNTGMSGWAGEADARTATNTPQFAEVAPPKGEIYANPQVTQWMLDDSFFNVEQFLGDVIGEEFAVQEGNAFVVGNGTSKPKGVLAYTTAATADSDRAFGTLEHLATGVSGDWPASNPADILMTLQAKLNPRYKIPGECAWMMNSNTLEAIRKFKDGNNNYIWRAGLEAGQADMLLGYPIIESPDMPDIAANSLSIAFGNWRKGYLIADRTAIRSLRDPFTNKPYVGFYTTKRVSGAVVNSRCIKLLKFATT